MIQEKSNLKSKYSMEKKGNAFKEYPEYKISEFEWLGNIPRHWDTVRLKFISSINDESLNKKTDPNLEIEYVDIGNVDKVYGIIDKERMLFKDAPSRARRIVKEGDVIVSTVRTYLKAIAPIDNDNNIVVSTGFAVVRPIEDVSSRFTQYALRSSYFIDSVVANSVGVSFPAINTSVLEMLPVVIPPNKEQKMIASFLDRETERIDRLIKMQERLIELLEEKRTALISHAVTKGLDPDVELKDSSFGWLGEIPEHWDLVPLKYIIKQSPGSIKTGPFGSQLLNSDMQGDEIKVYDQKNVIENDFGLGDKYVSKDKYKELKDFQVYPGDILVSTRGSIGECMVLPHESEKGILHPCLLRVQPDDKKIDTDYLVYFIEESYLSRRQLLSGSNATTIEVIYSNTMKELNITLPPISEQRKIVERIDEKTSQIEKLLEKVGESIAKLEEYRVALISAAVTGKIDVRDQV